MKRNTVLLAAMFSLAPLALLAANTPDGARDHGWFKHLDANGDGVVSKDEAQAAANARVEKTFAELDTNKDGQITQDEVRAAHDARRAEMEAKFEERFKEADTNGDSLLSKEEAQAGMPRLARGFDRLDTNKDGTLSLDEIKAGRQAMAQHMRDHGWKGHPPVDGAPSDSTQSAPSLR
jgi:Ca2+-binding EF-hand superfamily protein